MQQQAHAMRPISKKYSSSQVNINCMRPLEPAFPKPPALRSLSFSLSTSSDFCDVALSPPTWLYNTEDDISV